MDSPDTGRHGWTVRTTCMTLDFLGHLESAGLIPICPHNGYLYFQDHAGDYVKGDYVMNGGNAGNVLDQLNALYRKSRGGKIDRNHWKV